MNSATCAIDRCDIIWRILLRPVVPSMDPIDSDVLASAKFSGRIKSCDLFDLGYVSILPSRQVVPKRDEQRENAKIPDAIMIDFFKRRLHASMCIEKQNAKNEDVSSILITWRSNKRKILPKNIKEMQKHIIKRNRHCITNRFYLKKANFVTNFY